MTTLATRKFTVFGMGILILGLSVIMALLAAGAFGSASAGNGNSLPAAGPQTVTSVDNLSQEIFTYSTKVVCVPDLAKRRRSGPGLQPGLYRTAVNVHNPWDQPANIEKWLTLSPPQGGTPKKSVRQTEVMAPETAFDVDCIHMKKDFLVEESSGVFVRIGRVPSGKGFLVVRSDRPLDVVAVYTVAIQEIEVDPISWTE